MTPTRRDFLGTAAAALGLGAVGCAKVPARRDAPLAHVGMPVFPLSLGQWSLHRMIRSGALRPVDFPRFARERFDVGAVDYVSTLLGDVALDDPWLDELRRRADDVGVDAHVLLIDLEERLGDPDATRRAIAVDGHRRWIEAARILGCHAVRVNAYSAGSADEQMRLCAEGLYRLCDLADPLGLDVLVENHGGLSSRGDWLAALVASVGHPRLGSLPDFGNWEYAPGLWYDRYRGVAELMPSARAVSAKAHDFDASGNETSTDFERMLRVVAAAGYTGPLEVEYEGERLSEEDGIRATIRLIRTVSSAD